MRDEQRPAWRQGWPWTLLKCAAVMALSIGGFVFLFHWLVRGVEVPWWLPKAVYEWIVENVGPVATFLGIFLGALVGFFGSVFTIVWDASKGRLTRVR